MKIVPPKPGLIIRYGFQWADADQSGQGKVRPCAIILAIKDQHEAGVRTVVAPITHSPPLDPARSLEMPAQECRQVGLDDGPHWVRLDQLNDFLWPGFDLYPVPNKPDTMAYGMVSKSFYEALRKAILDYNRENQAREIVNRD